MASSDKSASETKITDAIRVMLIDDQPADRDVVRRMLDGNTEATFLLDEAADLETAETRLAEQPVDAVLLGLETPEAFKAVQRSAPSSPIIILTRHADPRETTTIFHHQAYECVERERLDPYQLGRLLLSAHRYRRTTEAVHQSEALYRAYFEQGPDPIFLVNPDDLKIVDLNEAACEFLGYTPEELSRLSIPDIDVMESAEELAQHMQTLLHDGGGQFNTKMQTKDREVRETRVSTTLVHIHSRLLLQCTCRDITERRRVEDQLTMHSRTLATLAEGVAISGSDGVISYTNPAFDRMFGYECGELVGKHVSILNALPDEENQNLVARITDTLERDGTWTGEFANKRKDGSLFTSQAHVSALVLSGTRYWISVQQDITARKEMEQALRASEERYRTLYEHIPVMYFTLDAEGRVLSVNAYGATHLGYSQGQLMGQPVLDVFHEDDRAAVQESLKKCLAKPGTVAHWVFRKVRQDGKLIWVEEAVRAIHDADGQLVVLVACEDITERKRAEEARDQSEARYRAVLESQSELICRFARDGRLTFVNTAYCRYFGKLADDLLGQPFVPRVPEEDQAIIKQMVATVNADHPVVEIEHRVVGRRGDIRWQRWVNTALFDDEGTLTEIQAVGSDITKRKVAEIALRESEARFRRLFDVNLVGFMVADFAGSILKANDTFLHMLGYTQEDLPLRWDELTPEEWRAQDAEKLREIQQTQVATPYEKEYVRADGTRVPVWLGATTIESPPDSCICLVLDISERRAIEKDRAFLSRRLLEVQEEERQRISAALHDQLGQLLTLIRMDLSSVSTSDDASEKNLEGATRRIDEALDAVRRMAVSLRPPLLDDLGLKTAMESLIEEFAETSGIRTSFSVKGKCNNLTPPQETCLYRILQESLTNTARHAKASEIQVFLTARDGWCFLETSDDGIGFDPDASPQGESLGLLGMKERLAQMGGRLQIESSEGGGTRIRASMPPPEEQGGASDD